MTKLHTVNVNGAPFAKNTTLTNAAQLVDKINRVFAGEPASLGEPDGTLFNPSHAAALAALDAMGLTKVGGVPAMAE